MHLYQMADKALAHKLEAAVEQSGWHRYFEQVNARGELASPEEAIKHMIARPS